jgi:hypothetical protein
MCRAVLNNGIGLCAGTIVYKENQVTVTFCFVPKDCTGGLSTNAELSNIDILGFRTLPLLRHIKEGYGRMNQNHQIRLQFKQDGNVS